MLTKILLITILFALITIFFLIMTIKLMSKKQKENKQSEEVLKSYNEGVKKLYETATKINKDDVADAFNECLSVLRKYADKGDSAGKDSVS